MAWNGAPDTLPSVRIMTLAPSLHPTERQVAEAVRADPAACIENTAQELATRVGVGRSTVVRTAQTLGYDGYPQLRVAVAQELALGSPAQPGAEVPGRSALDQLRARAQRFAAQLPHAVSALTEEAVEQFITAVDTADRVLVVANGLSSPLGLDLVLRLTAAGRSAEHFADPVAQQIVAGQLSEDSVCVVISGSGINRSSVETMRSARDSGATIIALTSFAGSPVADLADVLLLLPPDSGGFRDELLHTSRAAFMLLIEFLIDAFHEHRGERGRAARTRMLGVLGGMLQEE